MVHPLVEYVHAWDQFFSDCIYTSVEGITTAREFILRERANGAVAFWYKPDSSHAHLYPALKDANNEPVECTLNGEKAYEVDPDGIEVFKTMCAYLAITHAVHTQRDPKMLINTQTPFVCAMCSDGRPSIAHFC